MIHRMLVLILVACLLGGCSGGGTTEEADPPEQSAAIDSVETPVADGVALETQADSLMAAAIADDGPKDASEVVEESEEVVPGAESLPADNSAAPAAPPDARPSTSGLRVLRAYVCKGIEQSEPTEAGKSFIPQDGVLRLCCFSEIAGAAGPDTVYHIWRWGDREMARVTLEVKSQRWRTWSTKRILDEWRGEWHVDVTDSEGGVLTRLEFSVE